jgi:alpha-tubulin suppressor-like RCC1 family protein
VLLGEWSACVVTAGVVSCWGHNDVGQLGYHPTGEDCYFMKTTVSCSEEPNPVPGLSRIVAVVGDERRCALDADGRVCCWGAFLAERSAGGALVGCQRSQECRTPPPRRLTGLPPIVELARAFTFFARDARGQVYSWGRGNVAEEELAVTPVPELAGVSQLAGDGERAACARLPDGTVSCWEARAPPPLALTPASGLDRVIEIGVAEHLRCALRADLTVWCWGEHLAHVMGLPDSDPHTPIQVLPAIARKPAPSAAASVNAGAPSSAASVQARPTSPPAR